MKTLALLSFKLNINYMWNPFTKTVYTDTLAKWREAKVGSYNFLDKVLINTKGYLRDKNWEVWLIYQYFQYPADESYYSIIFQDGTLSWFNEEDIKPYYWEFQEEFEALQEAQKLQLEISERSERLNKLIPKLDKIKDKNLKQILWTE